MRPLNLSLSLISNLLTGCLLITISAAQTNAAAPGPRAEKIIKLTNGNVRVEYNLETGTANFYWKDGKKISGFYSAVRFFVLRDGAIYYVAVFNYGKADITKTLNLSCAGLDGKRPTR